MALDWVQGPIGSKNISCLVLGWGCTDRDRSCVQSGVFLDSQLLLDEQVVAFVQLCLIHQFHPFLDCKPCLQSCPSHLQIGLLQCSLHGADLEQYLKASTGTESSGTGSYVHSYNCTHYTSFPQACQFSSSSNSRC